MVVGFHPGARLEMRESADCYDLERPGLGAEFLDEVERTMQQVLKYPKSSPVVLGHVRKRAVPGSPTRSSTLRVRAPRWTERFSPDSVSAGRDSLDTPPGKDLL
jgi:hypothetical protein